MNRDCPPLFSHLCEPAETVLSLEKTFPWAERHWRVPAAYVCGKGLLIDFCMRVDADELRAFMQKWRLSPENDDSSAFSPEEQLLLNAENPLSLDFTPALSVNGQPLYASESASASFNPCLPRCEARLARVMPHYGLKDTFGWVVTRVLFLWRDQRPAALHSIELFLKRTPAPLPGPRFTIRAPGDALRFTHSFTGTEHTLTALSLEAQTLPEAAIRHGYPPHFTLLRYALDPEPAEPIQLSDASEGDRPSSALAFFIGCADGSHVASSSPRFSPVAGAIEWRMTYHSSPCDDFSLSLL